MTLWLDWKAHRRKWVTLLIGAVERNGKLLECGLIPIVVFILSFSLGLGVVAIGPAGLSFTTFFLAITLLTPSKLIAHHSHGGNDLASMLESGSF